ncbi:hypothetical protein BKA81DRAFT_162304 [Phyllosticta paracitricarpa]|uniref:Uncharacterized protein n=1 Tax=Phyllosticta citricarpa TaxID=55181 RepID=A0ABR1MSG4_9PEZI
MLLAPEHCEFEKGRSRLGTIVHLTFLLPKWCVDLSQSTSLAARSLGTIRYARMMSRNEYTEQRRYDRTDGHRGASFVRLNMTVKEIFLEELEDLRIDDERRANLRLRLRLSDNCGLTNRVWPGSISLLARSAAHATGTSGTNSVQQCDLLRVNRDDAHLPRVRRLIWPVIVVCLQRDIRKCVPARGACSQQATSRKEPRGESKPRDCSTCRASESGGGA